MKLQTTRLIILLCSTAPLLTACIDAAVSGAQLAYNHSSIQNNIQDQYITSKAGHKLHTDTHDFDDSHIEVATFNREVLMTGQVVTKAQKIAAEKAVKSIDGVQVVYDQTEVRNPTPALKRISDAWITGKIKTQLIAMNEIEPSKIKVVTENGTVFLMGMVLPDQADIAIDIARNTDGVERVVKMFTYLRPSKV